MGRVRVIEQALDGLDEDQVDDDVDEPQHEVTADQALLQIQARAIVVRSLEQEQQAWVTVAREVGASWSEIGRALGVDKSTAMRRFREQDDTGPVRLAPGGTAAMLRGEDHESGVSYLALEQAGV